MLLVTGEVLGLKRGDLRSDSTDSISSDLWVVVVRLWLPAVVSSIVSSIACLALAVVWRRVDGAW
ncbi:hypothetical protein F2Q69_00040489 [Brassica cretica]|uniref:Uncharacterized protein n=1 Tax=Brassica cretica TaxID=69181 RepID=A0A8S9N4Y5_BRACR|nr:hypothetical protein F2Q69_00040489 [Brassica cretica]